MTGALPDQTLAGAFDQQRGHLVSVAHRILGSRTDAEDAVQEAWIRLARQDRAIDNLAGWLTTVVSRVCLDMLRSRKTRPESPHAELPELIVSEDIEAEPEADALLADAVGVALLVVLDTLGPAERMAFVLHDMFGVPFAEIAQILDKSVDATKMMASRARTKLHRSHRPTDRRQDQRRVVDAFLAASRDGDFDGLMQLLDPEVTWRIHTASGTTVKVGAAEVASKVQHGGRSRITGRRVLVNGESGVLAWNANGTPRSLMACTVVDGRIVEILSVGDPEVLAAMDLPAPDAQSSSGGLSGQ